ncbi:MAG TPA: hypothetical protein VHE34_06420 [Puia sp.]|uniref:hypothetical protein n=1 Tax=Puia sp. TaxID=2045100 RepID=UPI002CB05CFD|nr:hypothetical protein [Puia sp.]HVU94839.1 hypothetical protein [Puia sp.]
MQDTVVCPACEMENAYFDGVVFVCPDCDHKWSLDSDENPIVGEAGKYSEFDELAELKVPFFLLEHGKLYDCKIRHTQGVEESSIIPLAFKNGRNLQFIMGDARKLNQQNPRFVQEIIRMDYEYILYDGVRADYPDEYSALTYECATREDGVLIDTQNFEHFDFRRTDVL